MGRSQKAPNGYSGVANQIVSQKKVMFNTNKRLERLIAAAKIHGENTCEVDMEVGDLQAMLWSCWGLMSEENKIKVLEEHEQNLECDLEEVKE